MDVQIRVNQIHYVVMVSSILVKTVTMGTIVMVMDVQIVVITNTVVIIIEIPMVQIILREMQTMRRVNKIYIVQSHDLIVRRHVIVCLQH